MTDTVMSSDPWFIDIRGSVNNETEQVKRDRFYEKIIAIGQAIQSGLHKASKPRHAAQQELPATSKIVLQASTVSSLVDPITSTAAVSAFEDARKEIDAAKRLVHERRRQIESSLYAPSAHQSSWKHKKHAEDVQGSDPELDIEDILARAQMLVPPVSGLFAQKQPASESFDENDYYSSQAESSISSLSRHHDVGHAAEVRSEGEVSEEEFEPELLPVSSTISLLPAFQDAADAAYEPAMMISDQEDDDYEPPMVESPPYEPVQADRPVQQLVNALAGQPLAPRAIAINHIQSPVAPQPSHISPVTTATFAQQLDHSAAEQSSRSDPDTAPGRGKKAKGKGRNANNNKQKGASKKRKRAEENDARTANANKRRSQGDVPFIKQEPVTPPTIGLTTPKLHGQTESLGAAINVPIGYKLVPIRDDEHSGRPQNGFTAPELGMRQHPLPLLRDNRGVEYYAYAEPQMIQQHGRNYRAPGYGQALPLESYAQHSLHMHGSLRDDAYSALAPQVAAASYAHTASHRYQTPQLRAIDHAVPSASGRFTANSMQLGSGRVTYAQPMTDGPYLEAYSRDTAHGTSYMPPIATPAGYELPRAQSVHPQALINAQHYSNSMPRHASAQVHARATSVYPSSNQPPPMSSHQARLW